MTFKYYREFFTKKNAPTEESKSFQVVKENMFKRYTAKMTAAEAKVEAENLKYDGKDMNKFLEKAEHLYSLAGFTDEAKYGLIKRTIGTDNELLKLTVLRTAKTYKDVKTACLEFAGNPDVFATSHVANKKSSDDDIEEIRRQLKDMKLLLTKKFKDVDTRPPNREPYCPRCKKYGHFASQ